MTPSAKTRPPANTAFFLSQAKPGDGVSVGHHHLVKLAKHHGLSVHRHDFEHFSLTLVGDVPARAEKTKGEFSLGRQDAQLTQDRFLRVAIDGEQLRVVGDYAGSVPVFYSWRDGLCLSNIEPAVFLETNGRAEDMSAENVFGFLKFGHFIWDETAWQHIFQTLPDSETRFDISRKSQTSDYLKTVTASDARQNLSADETADAFYELNKRLVIDSMGAESQIILPLSSGYDSRLILAALAEYPDMAARTKTFTYGARGSIEVHAARALAKIAGVSWAHIDLPCDFLSEDRLFEIGNIFGASLHMHGMYQLEFWDEICRQHEISEAAVLTSGFMTGVPAGQHNGLLNITSPGQNLVEAMRQFSQSKVWDDATLQALPIFSEADGFELAEQRFRKAFDRFDGEVHQKAVMFDVWTRQRNFISYYPRSYEWVLPTRSPHMNAEYANFFMSISADMLFNRRAVELMFKRHYPQMANVISNSNGFSSLGGMVEKSKFFAAKAMGKLGLSALVPENYRGQAFDFDRRAVMRAGPSGLYPLFDETALASCFSSGFGGRDLFQACYQRILKGDLRAYEQLITVQALGLTTMLGRPEG